MTIAGQGDLAFPRFLANDGNVAKTQLGASITEHRYGFEGLGTAALLHGTQFTRSILLAHHAGRQITGHRADTLGHLIQGKANRFQTLRRHINTDLLLRQATNGYAINPRVSNSSSNR